MMIGLLPLQHAMNATGNVIPGLDECRQVGVELILVHGQ
jgi:hypothetical protein